MSLPALPSFADLISADPVSKPDSSNSKDYHFESRRNPERLGNSAPIAFGGCVIAVAVHSAYQTLPPPPPNGPQKFHLYSVLGTFHGPTKTDRKQLITVTITRNTKTFATRRVATTQVHDDGTTRTCADFFIDFHAEEPDFLSYNPSPVIPSLLTVDPTDRTQTADPTETLQKLLSAGHITQKQVDGFRTMFRLSEACAEIRHCLAGVSSHGLLGLVPHMPTPQDHLPIPAKTSYEWVRIKPPTLPDEILNMTALSFIMDQAIAFVPLNHTHRGFQDAGACSTLEFAFRIFVPNVKMEEWHLRERKTIVAGMGRTYSESRLFDKEGRLLCNSTQACILRAPVKKEKNSVSKI